MTTNKDSKTALYLKKARLDKGLSQLAVAREIGLSSPQYISNFERGLCAPSIHVLEKLVKIYRLNPRKLVDLMIGEYRRTIESRLLKSKR